MLFTPREMELICVFHAGTLPATLEALRRAVVIETSAERQAAIYSTVEKLSGMSPDENVSLMFDL